MSYPSALMHATACVVVSSPGPTERESECPDWRQGHTSTSFAAVNEFRNQLAAEQAPQATPSNGQRFYPLLRPFGSARTMHVHVCAVLLE